MKKILRNNIQAIENALLQGYATKLVAVSKTRSVDEIKEAYDTGQRHFGENKVQEMCEKHTFLPSDIQWHLIGHLQTNKVKYIADFVYMIHSVDSEKLLHEINKRAQAADRCINCLLQIHIADEDSKYGLSFDEARQLLLNPATAALEHVRIKGFMGMATLTDDEAKIRTEFRGLKNFSEQMKQEITCRIFEPEELSMGMSGDYLIAAQEGSTLVRIGSAIFGERKKNAHNDF